MQEEINAQRAADLKKGSITFKLTKRQGKHWPYYPPSELVPGICEVSTDTGAQILKYVPGMPDIYASKWSDDDKKRQPKKLKFTTGYLIVDAKDVNKLNFMRECGYNKANNDTRMPDTSVLFEEIDYEAKAKIAVEADAKVTNAKHFVQNADIEEVRAYAQALCKNKAEVDALYNDSEFTIRYKLRNVAQTKPETFLRGLQSEELKNKVAIIRALQRNIIRVTEDDSSLAWTSSGEVFITAPSGMQPINWFADMTKSSAEHKNVLNAIVEMMDDTPSAKEEESATLEPETPWFEQVFENSLKSEKILKKGTWYIVPHEDEDEDPVLKTQKKQEVLDAISVNADNIMSRLV